MANSDKHKMVVYKAIMVWTGMHQLLVQIHWFIVKQAFFSQDVSDTRET
jgi:hypothetical protein